jgi:hypothetical protein
MRCGHAAAVGLASCVVKTAVAVVMVVVIATGAQNLLRDIDNYINRVVQLVAVAFKVPLAVDVHRTPSHGAKLMAATMASAVLATLAQLWMAWKHRRLNRLTPLPVVRSGIRGGITTHVASASLARVDAVPEGVDDESPPRPSQPQANADPGVLVVPLDS